MNPERFEKLVSDWLDNPQDVDLRARIDAAVQADANLAVLLERWQRLDRWLRTEPPLADAVDWCTLKARLAAATQQQDAERRLDKLLRDVSGVADGVNWTRFRQRVAVAVDAAAGRAGGQGRFYKRIMWPLAAGLAAAAALVFAVRSSPVGHVGTSGVWVHVAGPPAVLAGTGTVEVRLAVAGPIEQRPECFLMIDAGRELAPGVDNAELF